MEISNNEDNREEAKLDDVMVFKEKELGSCYSDTIKS